MNICEDNHDLGYIEIIADEEDLYKDFNITEKMANNFNNNNIDSDCLQLSVDSNDVNIDSNPVINEEMDENVDKYYYSKLINGKKLFICKLNDFCNENESLIVSHIKTHLNRETDNYFNNKIIVEEVVIKKEVIETPDDIEEDIMGSNESQLSDSMRNNEIIAQNETKVMANNVLIRRRSDRIVNMERNGLVCEECHKRFTSLDHLKSHKREHLIPKPIKESRKTPQKPVSAQKTVKSGSSLKDIQLKAKLNDKQTIHMNALLKDTINENLLLTESQIKAEILEEIPIDWSEALPEQIEEVMDTKPIIHQNFTIDYNKNDSLLSCKGLSSVNKLKNLIEKTVIDGKRFYLCKWNQCQYKNVRSQKIAEHVNLRHFGAQFHCFKPNCNKVFLNPNSWREHQKNHNCGFGILKNPIGICCYENLDNYWEKLIIDNKRSFKCTFSGCGAVLRTDRSKGIRRHVHSMHVCPYRTRGMGFHKFNFYNNPLSGVRSQLTTDTKNTFVCKCGAKYAYYSRLLQHKSVCKLRKVTKTLKTKQTIGNKAIVSRPAVSTAIEPKLITETLIKRPQNPIQIIKIKPNKRIMKKIIQNEKIGRNLTINTFDKNDEQNNYSSNEFKVEIIPQHLVENRRRSSLITQQIINNNQKFTSITPQNESQVKTSLNDILIQNENNVNKYIDIKSIDGEPNYFCKWNDCRHYENSSELIIRHINDKHFGSQFEGANRLEVRLKTSPKTSPYTSQSNSIKRDSKININFIKNTENSKNQLMKAEKPRIEVPKPETEAPLEIIGSYGTELSLQNFEKYSKRVYSNGKAVFVCVYPNCNGSQRPSQSLRQNKCYKTNERGNMIRHIRRHTGEKPFVCEVIGCEKSFSECTQLRNHIHKSHI